MGNENERKRDPSENRENRQGHEWDEVKTGGDERNVGLTGDRGFGGGGVHGSSPGTGGVIGGSPAFLSGEDSASGGGQQSGYGSQGGPAGSTDPGIDEVGSETKQVLTGDQSGGTTFGGQTGSGTSAIAANNSSGDLGAGGPPGGADRNDEDEPRIGPGGQSEIGGASDLGGGETGQGDGGGFIGSRGDEDGSDYLQKDGNPQAGFAERGRGAPDGSQPEGPEGTGERTANRDSDIEGSSSTR